MPVLAMKFLAAIMFRTLVAIRHFDGEISFHFVRKTPFGFECKTLGRRCLLLRDGSIKGPSWVDDWAVA